MTPFIKVIHNYFAAMYRAYNELSVRTSVVYFVFVIKFHSKENSIIQIQTNLFFDIRDIRYIPPLLFMYIPPSVWRYNETSMKILHLHFYIDWGMQGYIYFSIHAFLVSRNKVLC